VQPRQPSLGIPSRVLTVGEVKVLTAHILDNEQMNALTMGVATCCKKDQSVRSTRSL
jgi:hypothetical protein